MSRSGALPYVIGQWVRGPRFYGRAPLLAEVLDGPPAPLWLAGLRRIGKTSLLRQLEELASGRALLPLFWDLQGVESEEGLASTYGEALLDAEERLGALGIAPEEIDADPFTGLEELAGAARSRAAEILLLLDEADALLELAGTNPALPPRLWRALAAAQPLRAVLASSLRLADLGMEAGASRRVAGLAETFGTPRPFGVLTGEEARALLRQDHLPEASRPAITEPEVEAIRERCGNHPMLLQILGKRLLELDDLEEAFRQVAADHSVRHLFAIDFDLLAPAERELLQSVATSKPHGTDDQDRALRRLLALGLLHRSPAGGLAIANRYLAEWLRASPAVLR